MTVSSPRGGVVMRSERSFKHVCEPSGRRLRRRGYLGHELGRCLGVNDRSPAPPDLSYGPDAVLVRVLVVLGVLMALFVVYTSWQQVEAQERLATIVERQGEMLNSQQQDRETLCRQVSTRAVALAIADGMLADGQQEMKPEAYEELRQARERARQFDSVFPPKC